MIRKVLAIVLASLASSTVAVEDGGHILSKQKHNVSTFEFVESAHGHFLPLVNITAGNPPQSSLAVVDLSQPMTHLFLSKSSSYLHRFNKFYKKAESETARFINQTHTF